TGAIATTDSDTVTINIAPRRNADLAWTLFPSSSDILTAGEPQTLIFTPTHNSPHQARDVRARSFTFDPTARLLAIDPSGCRLSSPSFADCRWEELSEGESKTISLTVNSLPRPQREDGFLFLSTVLRSSDDDPNFQNDDLRLQIPTHCSFYID